LTILFLALATQAASASRILSFSADLAFGTVPSGTTTQLSFTVSNIGSQNLTVQSVDYPAGFSGDFSSGPLHPGETKTVHVTFAPTQAIDYGGVVTVNCNKSAGPDTISVSGSGTSTRIIALSGDVNFGNVVTGTVAQATFYITNSGNSTLTVSSISYPSGFNGDFPSGTISAGSAQAVHVTFSPDTVTGYSGSVTVSSDATSGGNSLNVSGAGIAATRTISLSGDLDFGNVNVGSSGLLTLTITNNGNSPLTVSSIDYPAGFTGAFSGVIASGANTNVTVTFSPIAPTGYSGTVTVNSDATSGVNTVNASGTGIAVVTPTRSISLSGDLNFGDVNVGSTGQLTLTITNSGNSDLTFTNIEFPSGFSGDILAGVIASGSTTNVTVTFSPLVETSYNGTVTVDSDATDGTNTVNASGNGTVIGTPTRIIALSGDLNFGSVGVGSTPQLVLTITNLGDSDLTITSIDLPAGYSADVTAGVIAAGTTTNVTITFSPVAETDYNGAVTVNSDATSGTDTVNISGTGVAAVRVISLSGDLDFGNVKVGLQSQLSLIISNAGNAPLTVTDVSYPTGFSGDFAAGTIAAGASTNVTVTFAPESADDFSGLITVDSDADSGANTVNVTGSGFNFVPSKSKFTGLFYPDDEVTFGNSGYFRATTGKASTFSAKVQVGGKKYPFTGRFSGSGVLTAHVHRKGLSTLTVTLQAGFDGGDQWRGTISDGIWTSDVVVNRSTYNKKKNPAPQAGTYALTIAGSLDVSQAPTANGNALVTISTSGAVKITGTLGDGATLTQVTAISKDSQIPLFGSLYSGKGSILGWLNVTNDPGHEINGAVGWFKLPSVDPVNYPVGFFFETTADGAKQ
jgi:uncharacterized membrane protein